MTTNKPVKQILCLLLYIDLSYKEEVADGFRVVLFNEKVKLKANEGLNGGANVTENVTENRLHTIIKLMEIHSQITTEQLATELKVTKRTILRDIEKLKRNRTLVYKGSAKGGYWKVLKKGNK